MKKTAFTLAEVLITLVIIGVVAALTIPNLMQKYTDQETVKKLQKFYSNLSNAYSLAVKDNGPVDEWNLDGRTGTGSAQVYEILFKPYFKISRNCMLNKSEKCVPDTPYKNISGSSQYQWYVNDTHYKIVLDDGAHVWWSVNNSGTGFYINYDVNGKKEPNKWGIDTFEFWVNKGKMVPQGAGSRYNVSYYCSPNTDYVNGGLVCTAWVIYKGNMDYLHCNDLSWTGKDKCK